MTTRLVIPRAVAHGDVEAALDYYVDTAGVDVALKFVASLESAYRIIAERPATGSPRFAHELGLPGLRGRKLARFPHLIFYFDRGDHIDVWRILHVQQDIPNWLTESEN
jgi:toxin ParE1/3/4